MLTQFPPPHKFLTIKLSETSTNINGRFLQSALIILTWKSFTRLTYYFQTTWQWKFPFELLCPWHRWGENSGWVRVSFPFCLADKLYFFGGFLWCIDIFCQHSKLLEKLPWQILLDAVVFWLFRLCCFVLEWLCATNEIIEDCILESPRGNSWLVGSFATLYM